MDCIGETVYVIGVQGQRPNSGFQQSGPAACPKESKVMVKRQESILIKMAIQGKWRWSTSAHLPDF
jgi:hypothetical protein